MKPIHLLILFLIATASASDYQDHRISFTIPDGWNIAKDDNSNISDTKIILADNSSAIRIDIVNLPQIGWLRNISSNDNNLYSIAMDYYKTKVLNPKRVDIHSISSSDHVHPDEIRQMLFGTNMDQKGGEWITVWSRPEYGDKFIGIHALFDGRYPIIDLSYNNDWVYPLPLPVFEILDSFRTDTRALLHERNFSEENPLTDV